MRIYLCGNIEGLEFEEVVKRYKELEQEIIILGHIPVSPLRGREDRPSKWDRYTGRMTMLRDLKDVSNCDMLYAEIAKKYSVGSLVEIFYAYWTIKIPVILVTKLEDIANHPWIKEMCTKVFDNREAALEHIRLYWRDTDIVEERIDCEKKRH